MKRYLALLALTLAPAAAQAMPAGDFVARWAVVARQDEATVRASSEWRTLAQAFADAGKAYRAEIDAARAAGRTPRSCPPPRISLTAAELADAIRALPAPAQRQELGVVLGTIMDRRYPCAPPPAA